MLNDEKMFERNFNEVRKACNTKWNIEIPEARDGIKAHTACPKMQNTLRH
jgi:hypothetical protein